MHIVQNFKRFCRKGDSVLLVAFSLYYYVPFSFRIGLVHRYYSAIILSVVNLNYFKGSSCFDLSKPPLC